ncbi:conserved hypothetical protein [Xenorhabdus bovienii str. oregonense]|uniref:Uncharacterized protein n=1 Tax=Xenorhabdus bovienii str. oregonense TaxID=1398202 RepID=A0A077P180_XENBV|nr:conserved hypothetical protein [Xenorhabdus bovienii str. oregonense]
MRHAEKTVIYAAVGREYCQADLDGSLAQSVEQLTFNQLVAGSNPARPTILNLNSSTP